MQEKLEPGTKVSKIWGRDVDGLKEMGIGDPEVLRHAKNGVWVMFRNTFKREIVIEKQRYPLWALEV